VSEIETAVETLVQDEMRRASERGFVVAVTLSDGDHVEVDIQREEESDWLRFYVDPHASSNEMRAQIRNALSKHGDLR